MSDDIAAIRSAFGRRILRERRERGWSSREFGAKADLSFSTISRAENGHEIWLSAALKISVALSVPLAELLAEVACDVCDGRPPSGFICGSCGRKATP